MKVEFSKLKDVAEFIRGITFAPTDVIDDFIDDKTIAVMRTKNVQNILDLSDVWKINKSFVKSNKQYLSEGDLLVSSANSWNLVGKACWVDKLDYTATFGGFVTVLRADERKVIKKYLYYWFVSNSIQSLLRSCSNKTTNISNLNLKRAYELKIPLPPLAEQKRIAAILDQAEEIRRKRLQAIEKLDQLAQSTFIEMFGDPVTNEKHNKFETLLSLCHRIQIGPFGTQLHEEDYVENGIPLVNPTHIKNGKIITNSKLSVTPEKHASLSQYHLKEGDLILGRRGEMGRCAIVNKEQENWLCGTGSLFLQLDKNKIHPVYLYSVLSSPSMKKHLESVAQGVTMANLNKEIVGNIKISLPSLQDQMAYVRAKESSKNTIEQMSVSLMKVISLSSSLQHQAFTTGFHA